MPHIIEAPVLQINRFYTGLYTFRNPLVVPVRQMGRRLIELYDALMGGQNMELTNQLTLKRRPGYVAYNSNVITGVPLAFYSFKPSSFPGQVFPVADTTTQVLYAPPGSTAPTQLIAKTTAQQTNFVGIGGYLYMGNPQFSQKWDGPGGPQGVTNWGIAIGSTGGGPNTAGTGADGGGLRPWTNPSNVTSAVSYATDTITVPAPRGTNQLQATNFGFSIPSANQVVGIKVTFDGYASLAPNTLTVQLLVAAGPVAGGTTKTLTLSTTPGTTNTLGGAADMWGTGVVPALANASFFGVQFQGAGIGSSITYSIRNVKITIFTILGNASTTLVAGSLTAQVGYQYEYCYGNSLSGHVSSPTLPSLSTGPFTTQGVQVTLSASPDPQVNQIHVFRTTDGGGQPFFELPTSPYANANANITDNAPDPTLQIANIAPLQHFNDPPPAGMVDPVWFAGRLWGHVGNQLFFASGPDITMGNGQEAWYPVYQYALPTTIIRKFPLPNGMLIVTTDDIYVVRGIDTYSFTVNEFMRDIGMRNWNAGDSDGSNVYLYTTDRQMLLLNANGLNSISSAVSDVIANVDPSAAYVTTFRYTAKNTMLFLGDGTTNLYPFNLNLQAWCPVQVPSSGVTAIGAIETATGVYSFLLGKNTAGATIAQRSLTTFSDEGTLYACSAIFGPIPFADALTLAQISDIVVSTVANQSALSLSVLANELSGNYQGLQVSSPEPPELNPSQTFASNRYGWRSTPLTELVNFIMMQMTWPAASTADELLLWAIGGTQTTGGSALGPPGQLPQIQGR